MNTLRRFTAFVGAAFAALTLSSCITINQEMWINADGSGRTVSEMIVAKETIEAMKGFAAQAGEAGEDPFDTAAQKKKLEADPNVKSVKFEEKAVGDKIHFIYDVEIKDVTVPLEDADNNPFGGDAGFEITKLDNGNFQVKADIASPEDQVADKEARAFMEPLFGDAAMTFRLHGPLEKHNGELDGDVAVWSMKLIDLATGERLAIDAEVNP